MDRPDPNLDDEDLMELVFENQQGIKHGDSCTMCEAEWAHHYLVHHPGCLYPVIIDLMETRSAIETHLDEAS